MASNYPADQDNFPDHLVNTEQGPKNTNDTHAPSERLFVTKVPRDCTEDELKAYFAQFGVVCDFHMPKIPGRGGHKGIAFISYEDPNCAQAVRETGGHLIRGQPLVVDHATARNPQLSAERKAASQRQMVAKKADHIDNALGNIFEKLESGGSESSGLPRVDSTSSNASSERSGGKSWRKGKGKGKGNFHQQRYSGYGGYSGNSGYDNESYGADYGGSGRGGYGGGAQSHADKERNRVFVTKIGVTVTKDNLIEYFSQFGALADCYVPQPNNPTQPHKGIAFVSFRDPRIAEEVLKRPSYEIKPGQYIVVDKANCRQGGDGGSGVNRIPQDHGYNRPY